MMTVVKLGFIVNPIAGMGGRVGLKGTDGLVEVAVARGAKPVAPERAVEFLKDLREKMKSLTLQVQVLTCHGTMGEVEAEEADFPVQVLPLKIERETTVDNTKDAVRLMTKSNVDLIVFVGGDGTARDIHDAAQENREGETLFLGIPSGVKMYSGVFSVNPSDAVDVVLAFVSNQAEIVQFEIVDSDETAIRSDVFAIELHGFLRGPFLPLRIQGSKQASLETIDEKENQTAIARFILEEMKPNGTYILGPGTTVRRLSELLNVKKTVLGVDIYSEGDVVLDVNEKQILQTVKNWQAAWIVLSPIGRQGILLGRGNQQISPEVIRRVGKHRIIVIATKNKLNSVDGGILRVDTGNLDVDNMIRGYIKVVTDYREWRIVQVQ